MRLKSSLFHAELAALVLQSGHPRPGEDLEAARGRRGHRQLVRRDGERDRRRAGDRHAFEPGEAALRVARPAARGRVEEEEEGDGAGGPSHKADGSSLRLETPFHPTTPG